VWKEFRGAATGTRTLVALMLIGYTAGLVLIGSAIM
jgi:glucose uptake protein